MKLLAVFLALASLSSCQRARPVPSQRELPTDPIASVTDNRCGAPDAAVDALLTVQIVLDRGLDDAVATNAARLLGTGVSSLAGLRLRATFNTARSELAPLKGLPPADAGWRAFATAVSKFNRPGAITLLISDGPIAARPEVAAALRDAAAIALRVEDLRGSGMRPLRSLLPATFSPIVWVSARSLRGDPTVAAGLLAHEVGHALGLEHVDDVATDVMHHEPTRCLPSFTIAQAALVRNALRRL